MTTEVFAHRATVVLVTNDERRPVGECLEALRSTLGPRDRVIASSDALPGAISKQSRAHPRVELVLNQEDCLFADASNDMLDFAHDEFIIFLNQDAFVSDGWLEELLAPFQRPNVGAAGPLSNRARREQVIPNIEFPSSLEEVPTFAARWRREHANRYSTVDNLDDFCIAIRSSTLRNAEGFELAHTSRAVEGLSDQLRHDGLDCVIAHAVYVHRAAEEQRTKKLAGVPLLSVCLIVKDEEEMLGACLASVADIAHEIVVYDTGSSDSTVEIARRAGANVIEGYWDNDFARARNAALEHATGHWVLTLDADEIFQCDAESLFTLLERTGPEVEAFMIAVENLEGVGSVGMTHMSARVARRTAALWRHSLHEQLVSVEDSQRELRRVHWSDARIVHRGYIAQVMKSKNKAERNLAIAKAALDTDEANKPYATLNYGRSLVMAGRAEEAIEVLREAATFSEGGFFSRSVLTTLVTILTDCQRYDEALEHIAQLRRYSTSQITADIAEGRARIGMGETELGLAILARLPSRGRDDDAFEYDTLTLTGIRASGLVSLGRYSEGVDLVLDSIRNEGVIKVNLGALVNWLVQAGREPREIAMALNVDDLIPALGQVVDLNVIEADAVLEGVYEIFPERIEPLVVAGRIGPRLSIDRALIWSSRLRQRGLSSACPLIVMASDETRDARERILAAAVAFGTFGERAVVRPVHEALALLTLGALEESTMQINRLAPGLLEADHVEPASLALNTAQAAPLPTKMIRAAQARASKTPLRTPALRRGVNVIGGFSATSIDGEVARTLTRALVASGYPVSTVDYNSDGRTGPIAWTHLDAGDQPYGTSLVVISPDELANYALDHGTEPFDNRYVIGVWRSEFDCPSTMMGVTGQMVREIWVPSSFAAQVVATATDRAVVKMNLALGNQPGSARFSSDASGVVFLTSVDYATGFHRQNPLAVVESFRRAFTDGEGPRLVIETAHASMYPLEHAMLLEAVGERGNITVLDCAEGATGRLVYDWTPEYACFVSLHRSEGTGLALARAMSCGMASIVTAHSCGVEFLGERDSYQIPYSLARAPELESYGAAGEYWTQPDVERAVGAMRTAANDAKSLHFKARKGRERAQRLFSVSAVRAMRERLSRIEQVHYTSESRELCSERAVPTKN